MRVVQAVLAVWFSLLAWTAPAVSLQSLEKVSISGSDYVRLGEWADSFDFEMKWPRKSEVITLTNAGQTLLLTIDSRKAEIGGTTLWLSLPVVNRGGVAMISLADLRSTLQPVLFPRASDAAVHTICLDPGHGGKDKGEISGSHFEKKYTLLLAADVAELLRGEGFDVLLTHTDDKFIELPDRPAFARQRGADLFVSLHYNSASGPIRGIEAYCLTPPGLSSSNEGGGRSSDPPYVGNEQNDRSVLLAYEVQKNILRHLAFEDRGVKRSRFEVLREARMPAILVEGGFMSSPGDASKIYDPVLRRKMARAIVDGIVAYKRAVEKPLARK
ncbi:MAG TPA: N-acetylmuramoyl-L-alanine amidase [Verrucomicrobiae bacterium]|jgi:N-acetylmuramoyl-L-alanine amidase|nr:N-acetylmuramoyl-L-alanine amidase [Verrucomicrobiae bacterium]